MHDTTPDSLHWFREARFGLFVHWGLYSLLGRGEWALHNEGIPVADYARLAPRWQPRPDCAQEWAALAREAGMGYMVLTTKHHDGFCLFDTRTTGFNAVHATPAGRDLVAEYVDACRAQGLRVGLYYSIADWSSPLHAAVLAGDASQVGAVRAFIHTQVEELLTRINDLWGYGRHDHNYKTRQQLLFLLANCACHGGNLLLNIGPRADGRVPALQRRRLAELGRWLAVNGEAIRGTERLAHPMSASGRVVRKGNALYYHVFYWPGREMVIADLDDDTLGGPVGAVPIRAHLLAGGAPLTTRWEGRRLFVTGLPAAPPDPADTVIVLEVQKGSEL
jgi:hypothetical protein